MASKVDDYYGCVKHMSNTGINNNLSIKILITKVDGGFRE